MIILILALIVLYLIPAVYIFWDALSWRDGARERLINGFLSLIWIISIPIIWLNEQL